ncbi:MAG TPA: DUF2335 domain-containing protein [Gemmatimonadales bacterium]|jgi:uncharacterized membrane protein|nr:DUF2335 domain-containing protein [Gemmatimonadales bacterium]
MELEAYAGPIPHPAILQQFEAVQPGFANRIMAQFEEQGRHRRKLENRVVWNNIFSSTLGQIMGFVLFAGAIGGGIFLLYHDKKLEGFAALVTAVIGAAAVLRKAETQRQQELARKREDEKKRR